MNIYTSADLKSNIASTIQKFHEREQAFYPTYLYIKQHPVTGKCYFGKTAKSEDCLLNYYNGSGKHWLRHINKHGKAHIETVWYCLFTDVDSLVEFALTCSDLWNIVKSDTWANLIVENGLDGQSINTYSSQSPEVKQARKDKTAKSVAKQSPEFKHAAADKQSKTKSEHTPDFRQAITDKRAKSVAKQSPEFKQVIRDKTVKTLSEQTPEFKQAAHDKRAKTLSEKSPEFKQARKDKTAKTKSEQTPEFKQTQKDRQSKTISEQTPEFKQAAHDKRAKTIARKKLLKQQKEASAGGVRSTTEPNFN